MAGHTPGNLPVITTAAALKGSTFRPQVQPDFGELVQSLHRSLMRVPAAKVGIPDADALRPRDVAAALTTPVSFPDGLLQAGLDERVFNCATQVNSKRAIFLFDLADRGVCFFLAVAMLFDFFKAFRDNPDPAQFVFSEVFLHGAADVVIVEYVTHRCAPLLH